VTSIRVALREEAPVLQDLRRLGIEVAHIQDLYQGRYDYRSAIPTLVSWLPKVSDAAVKEMLVRALTVPWARGLAGPTLVDAFETADNYSPAFRWTVGNAIEVVAEPAMLPDMIRLAKATDYGRAREMIVMGLGRIESPAAQQALVDLLGDPEVAGHAVKGLARLQEPETRAALVPFLLDKRGWVRLAARRAIEGIDRKVAAEAATAKGP
jgi:HEAT repeat protein